MKRNIITEITAIKSRSEFNSRLDFNTRLNDIEKAFNENLNYKGVYNKELLKYIPIAIVACFEAFFRSVYKELIDFGEPFSDNVIEFNKSKNVKFDFDIINAIQNKTVTVGEFISHILPCNNFEDINSNLSTLTNLDFYDEIKTFKKVTAFDNADSRQFIENTEQIFADIKRTFELRHIFCHEFATNLRIDKDEILRCFNNAKLFLMQTNDFIWELIYPNAPHTQGEMNDQATDNFANLEKDLSKLITVIKTVSEQDTYFELDLHFFDKTIIEWKKYRKVKAQFDSSYFKGGTIYDLFYLNSMSTTTEEKIASLKKEYEIELRKYTSS